MKLFHLNNFIKKTLKILCFSSLIQLSAFGKSTEAPFDGYIIKLKKEHSFMPFNNFLSNGEINELSLSFGDYYHFTPSTSPHSFSGVSLEQIKKNPDVEYIEPNYLYTHQEITNERRPAVIEEDTFFYSQWSLVNTGHNTWIKDSPPGIDINAAEGWKVANNNRDVIIAIIDSGIDFSHPDLKKNLWTNEAELNGIPGVDDDGNGFIDDIHGYDFANNDGDPQDGLGHGTNVAGILGATHNGEGIKGVMSNVKIMPLKFLTDAGPGDTVNAARAIDYAIKNGAQIINNSWGGGAFSQTMLDAFMAASNHGILLTAAAGNSKNDNDLKPSYPASYKVPNLITVASHNALDQKASFSNFGKNSVDVYAPGINIVSTGLNGTYRWSSGTSLSTPMVTGALGLLLATIPNISASDAKTRLLETSVKTPALLNFAKAGRVDIYRLLLGIKY